MRCIIGVDLGGTQLRVGLADEEGNLHTELRMPTASTEGPEAVIDQIVSGVAQVSATLGADAELLGVGVGSPGPIDPQQGVVFTLPNLPGWKDVPLRSVLEKRTGLIVALGNDANAAALGEWRFGGGKGVRDLVYVTVSTGIGGGVISDGRLLLGHHGAAAEVGHHVIDWATRSSWEELAAGPALARAAAEAMLTDTRSLLHSMTTPEQVTSVDVASAAAAGDPLAQRLLDREGELIGVGLVNMLHLYSPELILLGGGVVVNNPQLIDRAMQVIQERALLVYRSVPVRLASLGERAGLLGAVALLLYEHEGRI